MTYSRRFFYMLSVLGLLLAGLFGMIRLTEATNDPSQDEVALGIIVRFKEEAVVPIDAARQTPRAEVDKSQRFEQRNHERRAALLQDMSLPVVSHRTLDEQHHLLKFERAMRGPQLQEQLRRVRQHPDVAFAEPDVLIKRRAVPNDTNYANYQWYLQSPSATANAVLGVTYSGATTASAANLPTAWNTQTGLNTMVIAVVDTGVRYDHADLSTRLLAGYDFVSDIEYANDGDGRDADASDAGDWVTSTEAANSSSHLYGCDVSSSSWHGTFIAVVIGAITNNSAGMAGVNWSSKILPVRISGKCGALLSDLTDGIRWAAGLSITGVPANANPAKIINLSFGGSSACGGTYQSAIDAATAAGALIVVAAGNESTTLSRPADCKKVLTVGAARLSGAKTSYSNYGSNVALMTPGGATDQKLYSTSNSGTQAPISNGSGGSIYKSGSGTSYAAPIAVGVASLLLAQDTSQTPAQLVARMKAGTRAHTTPGFAQCSATASTQLECDCTQAVCGAGLLDATLALAQLANPAVIINTTPSVTYGTAVTLDGSGSTPSTGGTMTTYAWTQLSGTVVTLSNANTATATFTAPSSSANMVFKLQVTDSLSKTAGVTQAVSVGAPTAAATGGGGGGGGGATPWLWGLGLWLLALGLAVQRRANRWLG